MRAEVPERGLPLFCFGGGSVAKKRAEKARGEDGKFQASPSAKKRERDPERLYPRQCRGYLRKELARSFKGIVSGFVKQAESGSVQHLRLATELLGQPLEPRRRKSSALMLMETLGIGDEGRDDDGGNTGETP